MNVRSSGILLHPSSLPSAHGIGDLGPSAFRFADFLEIRADGHGEIEKYVVQNIQDGGGHSGFRNGIPQKDKYQGKIFERQDFPFPEADNAFSDNGCDNIVDTIIDQKEQGNLLDGK